MTEAEILPHHHQGWIQRDQNLIDELRWRPGCELFGEVDYPYSIRPGFGEVLDAGLKAGQQQGGRGWPQHRHRVWPEGDHH